MPTLTWVGSPVSDWFDPASWFPQAAPQPGDDLVIANGSANIASGDPEPIDGESIKLGSSDFANPASIDAEDASFGSKVAIPLDRNCLMRCSPWKELPLSMEI